MAMAEEYKNEPVWGGNGETVREAEQAKGPHLILELEGDRQEFKATRQANQFLLVRHADDLAAGGFATVRAVTILSLGQVVKDERLRLEGYLAEHGSADDYADVLYEALSACWSGETMLPLERSSDSSAPTETEPTASPSTPDSSEPGTRGQDPLELVTGGLLSLG